MNKMKSVLLALLVCLVGVPLFAQDRNAHIAIFLSQVEVEGDDIGDGFESDFETGSGFGIAASHAYNRFLSSEVAVFSVRAEAGLLFEGAAPFDLGRLSLVPVMLGGQLHIFRGRVDPYIGAGAAYVMANDLHSQELDLAGIGRIELDNELTYYVNAGIAVEITRGLGIVVDGRFVQYEPTTQSALTGVEQDLDLSPTILSAGLRFRF
jgi:opacity protein-like surface antigen